MVSALEGFQLYLSFFQQFFSFCIQQDCSGGMSHVVDFTGGMLCTFVESFQGQYKDGTNGTHDYRAVSASFLIISHPQDTHFGQLYIS